MALSFVPWKPNVVSSIDGKPLTIDISDLYTSFPHDRVFSPQLGFFLRPVVPIILVLLYLSSKSLLPSICLSLGVDGSSATFRTFVALHNLALAVFSFIVFVNSVPLVISHYNEFGMEATYCDQDGSLWNEGGLGAWAIIFYLSKYYEFMDTWVLIFKGRKASLLQTYHHSGIVLTMWGAVVSQSAWIMIVVVLNSAIHSLMYTYFFYKTLYPKSQVWGAKYLTTAQILQFITGIVYTLGVQFIGDSCDSRASRLVLAFIQFYAVGLIVLFVSFAKKKYKKK